jgi:hypothetical protein
MSDELRTRYFVFGVGAIYILIGIAGFIPALYTSPAANAPHVDATANYGYLFGIFPVNALHDVLNIVVGVLGVACFASFDAARYYARGLFLVFGLLAVAGFLPHANTLYGLVPIFGSDTWVHLATSVAGGFFGFVVSEQNVSPELEHAG